MHARLLYITKKLVLKRFLLFVHRLFSSRSLALSSGCWWHLPVVWLWYCTWRWAWAALPSKQLTKNVALSLWAVSPLSFMVHVHICMHACDCEITGQYHWTSIFTFNTNLTSTCIPYIISAAFTQLSLCAPDLKTRQELCYDVSKEVECTTSCDFFWWLGRIWLWNTSLCYWWQWYMEVSAVLCLL